MNEAVSSVSSSEKHPRGLVLTIEALEILENKILQWWEASDEKQLSRTKKLTREQTAGWLGIDKKTWDKIRHFENVDRTTLIHVFGEVNLPWKTEYCIPNKDAQDVYGETEQTCGNAPAPSALFIGRDEAVQDLRMRLCTQADVRPSGIGQKIVVLRGWPGVGKTSMAKAIACDPLVNSAYPDGVLWAELGTEPSVISTLSVWGRQLHVKNINQARTIDDASAQMAAALQNRRMLLIIDDVWKQEHAIPLLVGGQECAMLLTTRDSGIANALAPTERSIYRIPELTNEHSLELLHKLAERVVEQHSDACLELCKELEGLPLALQVAGRMLREEQHSGFDVTALLAELRQGRRVLEATAPADRADLEKETTPTVAVLLRRSTDRLDEQTRECFALLGPCVPKPATFGMDLLRHIWSPLDPLPMVRTLVGRGLMEAIGFGRYQMHALLVLLARSLLQG